MITVKNENLFLTVPFLCHISPTYFNYRWTQFAFLDWRRQCNTPTDIPCNTIRGMNNWRPSGDQLQPLNVISL